MIENQEKLIAKIEEYGLKQEDSESEADTEHGMKTEPEILIMNQNLDDRIAELETENMCMKMKMEAVEYSRTQIAIELDNIKVTY